jgi:hypothetical protein
MRKPSKKPGGKSQQTILGRRAFEAISAVEGLKLTTAGRKRVHASASIEQRRQDVLRAYMDNKGPK